MTLCLHTLCLLSIGALADDPCRSGPQPGQRPGPYSFVLSTGAKRGTSHCYICETADHPAIAVFARTLDDSLAKLISRLDQAVTEHKTENLRAWVTLLNENQTAADTKIVKWAKDHAIRAVPLGVFEDLAGPPSYRLAADADVTVLFFVKQQVVGNFAFRPTELTEARVTEMMKTLPNILNK